MKSMDNENNDFLNRLLETRSVPGFERDASNLFCGYLTDSAVSVEIDIIGNAFIRNHKPEEKASVMLEAHIDEIGFQVLYIDNQGFIYVRRDGGIDLHCLPGTQVSIHTQSGELLSGVIGKKPVHLMEGDAKTRVIELDNLWIDTGLSPEKIRGLVSVGDAVSFNPNMKMLTDKLITSKALDDKIGVFVIAEAYKQLVNLHDANKRICAVASVQEEIGSRGAVPCAYSVFPDIAICVDVDFATDVPDCSPKKYGDVRLGKGVVIQKTPDSNPDLLSKAERIAKDNGIPYQISARPNSTGGNDTSRVQLARGGVKTLGLGIPCRYMHTPVELCDLSDAIAAIDLIVALVKD